MNNFFKNERDRSDFFIALAVIGFFVWLFLFSGLLGKKIKVEEINPIAQVAEIRTPTIETPEPKVIVKKEYIKTPEVADIVAPAAVIAAPAILPSKTNVIDSDGDGVSDDIDRCPNESGSKDKAGCPDTDGDGIVDILDKCPNQKGSQKSKGCPDTDGDGVIDTIDRCPNEPGTKATKGCPEIKKEVIKRINLAGKQIQFNSGKASLKQSSFAPLDKIVAEVRNHPKVNISVEGHTDSTGNAANNQKLSEQRAETVKNYLVSKGLQNKITSKGFGSNVPIATNDTPAGRYENRRVEVKLGY